MMLIATTVAAASLRLLFEVRHHLRIEPARALKVAVVFISIFFQSAPHMPVGLMAMGEWGSEEALLEWAGEAGAYLDGAGGGKRRPEGWVDVLGVGGDKTSEGEDK